MHTYLVTFADGGTEEVRSERVQFTPTHIVFDNTENVPGGSLLIVALRAETVLVIEEQE